MNGVKEEDIQELRKRPGNKSSWRQHLCDEVTIRYSELNSGAYELCNNLVQCKAK